jgi:hypothetical protein
MPGGRSKTLGEFVDPLAASKAAAADKERLLLRIAQVKDQYARFQALLQLVHSRHREAGRLIIDNLEKIPKTPREPYWRTRTGDLAGLGVESGEEKVWKVLADTARRVDVGQRMQLLSGLGCAQDLKNNLVLLRYLKPLLDDREVRDQKSSERFNGPGAAFLFPRIAVRDFAAQQFAYVLDLPGGPDPTWKAADWAKLRRSVRARLAELEKSQAKEQKK